ncbi:MAG: phage tail family protein [Clostridia bacterium]|nr:phage tail family protein [Clostridia bacterium]
MRFNGVDPCMLHPSISIREEIPPGSARRRIDTIAGTAGEIVTGVAIEAGEYIVRVNIAGRTKAEGWATREKIAAWAGSSGEQTGILIPTHRPERCYDAILSEIGDPQFFNGFATVDVKFFLPKSTSRSVSASIAQGSGELRARIGGSIACAPVIRQKLAAAASSVTWSMDGKTILKINGSYEAGQTIEMDTLRESLTIDEENAMTQIDPQHTKWRPGFMPGLHLLASSDAGAFEMRWSDEWQ